MESQHEHTSKIVGGGRPYQDNTGPGPYIMSAESLEGDDVVNTEGEKLGTIESIMLDIPNGRIAYCVLSFGGVLGLGEKLFAIPWEAFVLDADEKHFILNVDKEALKDAPGFDKDHWPEMADASWASYVHSYYNFPPYWE
ncbi:MAG: PRC-barrel domain-containing protein [Gammaproteobacteria bacterium]